MPTLTVSTVGTSLLTNALRDEKPDRIGEVLDHANAPEDALPDSVQTLIESTVGETVDTLQQADAEAVRSASAELNGLLGLYQTRRSTPQDQHWLISTDTAVGRAAAAGVEQILRDRGVDTVQTYTPRGLSMSDTDALQGGVKSFLNWCEQTLPPYREQGFEVVFNLTGGFKSLQGILNTVGMFYADRMIYIFQTGPELITIPRLPVDLNTEVFTETPGRFLRLAALDRVPNATLPAARFEDLPDSLIDAVEGQVYSFSEWGLLLWNRERQSVLERDSLIELPRLSYTSRFRNDVRGASPNERRRLHKTLAIVSVMLETRDDLAALKRNGSLQYENYTDRRTEDGRPIGHFRLDDEREPRRVSCVPRDGDLVLRRFGRHDPVNANP